MTNPRTQNPLFQQAVRANPRPGVTGFGPEPDQTPQTVKFIREEADDEGNLVEYEDTITLVPHSRLCEPPRGYTRP